MFNMRSGSGLGVKGSGEERASDNPTLATPHSTSDNRGSEMSKNRNKSNNRTQGQETTPLKGQETTPTQPQPVKGQENPVKVDESLTCIIKSYQKFDGDKWSYHKNAYHLIIFDLLDDNNGRVDEHIPLSIGSSVDEISSLTVKYVKGSTRAMLRAVRILTPEPCWKVYGTDSKGQFIDGITLTKTIKDDKGQETEVPFNSASDSTSARFIVRDLVARVRKMTLVVDKDTSALTLTNLIKREGELNKKRALIASNLATLDPSSEAFVNMVATLDPLSAELLQVQGQIAKIRESQPVKVDIQAILDASLKRASNPTPTPETDLKGQEVPIPNSQHA